VFGAKPAPVPLYVPHISRGVAPYHSSQACSNATLCTAHLAWSGSISQQPSLLQCHFVYRTSRAEWPHITAAKPAPVPLWVPHISRGVAPYHSDRLTQHRLSHGRAFKTECNLHHTSYRTVNTLCPRLQILIGQFSAAKYVTPVGRMWRFCMWNWWHTQ
jgi:hypothetical protein